MLNENARVRHVNQTDDDRQPKTNYCFVCGRDVKNPTHYGHMIEGGGVLLHPEDEHLYKSDPGDMGAILFGPTCAKKIGLEWFGGATGNVELSHVDPKVFQFAKTWIENDEHDGAKFRCRMSAVNKLANELQELAEDISSEYQIKE